MKDLSEAAEPDLVNNENVYACEAEINNYALNCSEFNHKEFYMNLIKIWNVRRPRLLSNILH